MEKNKVMRHAPHKKGIKTREILTTSMSADALLLHDQTPSLRTLERPVAFGITDLLSPKSSKWMIETSNAPTSPKVLSPLSVPKTIALNPFVTSSSMKPKEAPSPSSTYAERLDQAENTDLFTYASALCHRVTGRYLPRSVLQSQPDVQEKELERVQRNPEVLRAIDAVRLLSIQFKETAQNVMGHRKELGHTLFRIEESYLKLFEKLLELSLRLYWEYEQRTGEKRKEDHATAEKWKEKYEVKCTEYVKLNETLAAKQIVHRARAIELQDSEAQMKEMEKDLENQRELATQIYQLKQAAALQRTVESKLRHEMTQQTKTHQDMMEVQKQLREESQTHFKELITDLRRTVRVKDEFIATQQVQLQKFEEILSVANVVHETRSSQTEVDDDGLWDVQDGIPRSVSRNVLHKLMWRRFTAFVACKKCGGRAFPEAKTTFSFSSKSQDGSQEDRDMWSIEKHEKVTKKSAKRLDSIERQWELPSHLVLFLSNLPKSVLAFPFYPLEHVILQIEAIFDDKLTSDRADEADGIAREELSRFICEYFLKTHGLRQSAEVGLYRFLISVKHTYHQNAHVRLFARLANLLSSHKSHQPAPKSGRTKNVTTTAKSSLSMNSMGKRAGYLDRSFLHVFLEARYYLLRPPPRKEERARRAKKDTGKHVIQVEPTKKWVPLDHAITVLRWYLGWLSEEIISLSCRQVECTTALYDGRTITETAGNRLAIRAEMRRVMLATEDPQVSSFQSNSDGTKRRQRPLPPRIVADVQKVLTVLMNVLEERRDGIKKDLTALFQAGDVNHDCVLTLDEFSAIIRQRKPHFSDRRILRMFREAIMGGSNQSFALSMDSFVAVCHDHRLVALLPDDRMVDPFVAIESEVETSTGRSKGLVIANNKSTETGKVAIKTLVEIPEDDLAEPRENEVLVSARAQEVEDDEQMEIPFDVAM